jgi:hypothetical protein
MRKGSIGIPPRLQRGFPGAVRSAPATHAITERIRQTLLKAQRKLLASRWKLQSGVLATRMRIGPRR